MWRNNEKFFENFLELTKNINLQIQEAKVRDTL